MRSLQCGPTGAGGVVKPGRPKLPRGERRDEIILVRLTKVERRMVETAAKLRGETLSAWLRAEIYAAAECAINERRESERSGT